MSTWLHYTKDAEAFENGLHAIASDDPATFAGEGLCVYRYHSIEQREVGEQGWHRRSILIECADEYVELLQPCPLDADEVEGDLDWYDEYIIPVSHFDKCTIL